MNDTELLCLNIGAGKSYIPGFRNIDISENAEIVLNLSTDPLPFENDSVDLVFSYHTLEHVPDYLFALSEIYRVLKDGGVFLIGVPYISLTEYNLVNPYHLNHFNEHSFSFFDPKRLRGSAEEDTDIYFHEIFHDYHYMGTFKVFPPPFRDWSRRHLFNVVRKIDFGLVAVKSDATLHRLPEKRELRSRFRQCKTSRRFYNGRSISKRSLLRRALKWWRAE